MPRPRQHSRSCLAGNSPGQDSGGAACHRWPRGSRQPAQPAPSADPEGQVHGCCAMHLTPLWSAQDRACEEGQQEVRSRWAGQELQRPLYSHRLSTSITCPRGSQASTALAGGRTRTPLATRSWQIPLQTQLCTLCGQHGVEEGPGPSRSWNPWVPFLPAVRSCDGTHTRGGTRTPSQEQC